MARICRSVCHRHLDAVINAMFQVDCQIDVLVRGSSLEISYLPCCRYYNAARQYSPHGYCPYSPLRGAIAEWRDVSLHLRVVCNSWAGQPRGFPVYGAIFHELVEEFSRSKPALATLVVVE